MPRGMAVESAAAAEVVAAWVVPPKNVEAVSATPGWEVLGQYYLPKTVSAKIEATMGVSAPGLTGRVRLWCVEDAVAVSGYIETMSEDMQRFLGPTVQLQGLKQYQFQAECIGSTGEDKFLVVSSATITD